LQAIERDPSTSDANEGPWFDLWSALCHQGDVYSASFAAVPHVVRILALFPSKACFDFFLFPASVEIARHRSDVTVPPVRKLGRRSSTSALE
jgi:hypothetical protein